MGLVAKKVKLTRLARGVEAVAVAAAVGAEAVGPVVGAVPVGMVCRASAKTASSRTLIETGEVTKVVAALSKQ